MTKKRKLTTMHISMYLIVFFVIWSVRELLIQPVLLSPLSPITSELIGAGIKLLVWTLPAILLIRHFHDDMLIGLKEMFTNKLSWSRDYLAVVLIITFLVTRFVYAWLVYGELLSPELVSIRLIGAVVFVGITEEVVFRGFLLNAFLKKMKTQYAIVLDAVLFTIIHYPIWIYNGRGIHDFVSGSITVAVLSMGFAYSFIKTRNIFVPIALHMAWNLSIHLFIR